MVTDRVKRRKLGDRVIRHFSPEITGNWCADVVYLAEGNMRVYRNGEISRNTTGLEVSHVVQWHCVNWGEPVSSARSVSVAVCPTTNEEGQRTHRQSDGRIIPMKAGNAARGKPRGDCASQSCHAK